jgi:hypothetical protein
MRRFRGVNLIDVHEELGSLTPVQVCGNCETSNLNLLHALGTLAAQLEPWHWQVVLAQVLNGDDIPKLITGMGLMNTLAVSCGCGCAET